MKKNVKKIYAVLIIIMLLFSYLPALTPSVKAALPENIEGEITLESTASKYDIGDTVVVNLVAKDLGKYVSINTAVVRLKYDKTVLEYTNCEIKDPENYKLRVTPYEAYINFQIDTSIDYGTIREGDVIFSFYFTALQDSTNETVVECVSDSTGGFDFTTENNGDGFFAYGDADDNIELPRITLPVKVEEPTKQTHNITVKLTDNDGTGLEGGIFKVTLPDGTTTLIETASDGTFTLENLQMPETVEPVIYTIVEKVEPEGYLKNEDPSTLTIIFDTEGNVQTVTGTNGVATNTGNDITLTIVNEKEEPEIIVEQETFYIELTKVDEENNTITTDEATFKISSPVAEDKTVSTTNGKTENIEFQAPIQAGTYPYVIEETKVPSGYVKGIQNTILDLKFENIDNTIKLTSANIISEGKTATIDEETGKKVIKVSVVNEKEKIVTKYDYKINIFNAKNDTFNTQITEGQPAFVVTYEENPQYIKSNGLGKTTYNFSLNSDEIDTSKEYIFTIEQVAVLNGYVLDSTPKTVKLTFNEDGSINEMTVDGQNIIKVDNTSDTANVKIIIEEEQVPVELVPEEFNLVINKQDEQGNLITSSRAKFNVIAPNGTKTSCETENGITTSISLTAPNAEGKQVYFIEETRAPAGYEKLTESIPVEMNFVEENGKIVISNAVLKQDTDIQITPVDVSGTKTITVSIKNNKIEKYYIDILNVDKDTDASLTGGVFKVTNSATNEYQYFDNNKLEITMPETAGVEVYIIKQISVANGYIINENQITLSMEFRANSNGSIYLYDYEVTGENSEKVTTTDANTAKLKIKNQKEDEVIEISKDNYTVEITKVDSEDGQTITAPTTFEIVPTTQKTYTTTNGTIRIENLVAGEADFITIQEKEAPEGYKLPNGSVTLSIVSEENNNKIVVTEVDVEIGSDIATAVLEGNVIKIQIKNTKKDPAPEVPTEPTPETFNLVINKKDEQGSLITSSNARFTIIEPNGNKTSYETQNGVTSNISLTAPNTVGKQVYFIQETKAPEGYEKLVESVALEMNFVEENEKIVLANAVLKLEEDIQIVPTNVGGVNTLTIDIKNSKIEKYYIDIVNVDKDTDVSLTGGVFKVTNSATNEYQYFDNNKLEIIMPETVGTEVYIIKQVSVANGYIINENIVTLMIEFRENANGRIYMYDYTVTGTNAEKITTTDANTAKLKIKNEKEDEPLYVRSKKDTEGYDIYDVMNSYAGRDYNIENPFIDTRIAKSGNNVTVGEFINNLESNGVLTVWDEQGNQISTTSRVKTKMILKANKGDKELTFIIVVKGDCDGDGRVRSKDLDTMAKHMAEEEGSIVTDPYFLRAMDLERDGGDGIIRGNDLVALEKNVLAV